MKRYGQPPAKPPPEQNCDFIMIVLLAMSQIQSGGMLWSEGILRTGEELLHMSQKSKRSLWNKYADQHACFTSGQVLMLKIFRFRAFLWAKLLGKQSWQPCSMRIRIDSLRHLMTKCIPRIRIAPIRMPERPVKEAWQLRGSVVYDPSGFMYNGRSHDWSECHHQITAITSHSKQPFIALMHSNGNVSIGKNDDMDGLFRVIHSTELEDGNATAMKFHPVMPIIAVAEKVRIMGYTISPSLKRELHFSVSFYESGYLCPKPKFSADNLNWNATGTFLTAISAENLSMCWFLDPATFKVRNGFNGGIKYAELRSFQKDDMPPSCSCFSKDGNLVMTGYSDGTLMTRMAVNTADKGWSLVDPKITHNFCPGKITKVISGPFNHSVFAIEVKSGWSQTSVLIVSVNHDGSVTITATIPDAKSPHFHEDWLLVLRENRILFYRMDRCNTPYLVTEFQLPDNGMMLVRIGAFCVITTPDGKVMLYYSISGESKLYGAEITLK